MIGIETEYGIYVEGKGAQDLVTEATHLVRLVPPPAATSWNYRHEHPRRDVRGFTVDHLSIDPTDAQFEQRDAPHSTDVEVRSDRALSSGARLYNDHGHPEFSTPECTSLYELVAHDRAGEIWMQRLAEKRSERLGGAQVALYKNNTDFHGASYGTHESYLTNRDLPFDNILFGLLPFFVTRQIFAGAGKVGCEQSGVRGVEYQLSQRADFFSTIASVDTLYNRPIVNTRDEPHADARRFRRLHVICGDANLCEVATFLKAGTTLLALRLIERGFKADAVALRDPVAAIKSISRDGTYQWNAERVSGGTIGAVEVQRYYLAAAKEQLSGLSPETDTVIHEWERVLDALESDPLSLSDTCDWVAKRALISGFLDSENLRWDDPWAQSLDLEYHNVDPGAGLYYALEQEGHVRRMVTDEAIAHALTNPPAGSVRAIVRGLAVSKFSEAIRSITWSRFSIEDEAGQRAEVRLSALEGLDANRVMETLSGTSTPTAFVAALRELERTSGAPNSLASDEEE